MAEKKKKVYVEKYYSLPEEDIQVLITKAKAGNSRAQMELLNIFSNFLQKYVALLYYGKYNLSDYDIRRFVALFVKDPMVRFYLVRNKLSATGAKNVSDAMRGIQYMCQRYGDEEDVDQTVKLAFLECINIYKRKEDIPFSGFLYSYFFYKLKKQVDALLIDQLGRKTFPLLGDEEGEDSDSEEKIQGFTAPPTVSAEDLIYCEEIDEYWVWDGPVMGPFANLTVQERQLIKWRYVDGEKSSDIAQRAMQHSNTLRENLNRIKVKILENLAAEIEV